MKSSPFGLYKLGYTRVTLVKTKRCYRAIKSKSLKITLFGLFFVTQKHEKGIISNHILV